MYHTTNCWMKWWKTWLPSKFYLVFPLSMGCLQARNWSRCRNSKVIPGAEPQYPLFGWGISLKFVRFRSIKAFERQDPWEVLWRKFRCDVANTSASCYLKYKDSPSNPFFLLNTHFNSPIHNLNIQAITQTIQHQITNPETQSRCLSPLGWSPLPISQCKHAANSSKRYLQNHLRHYPTSSWCLPRARMWSWSFDQHSIDHPRFHSWYHSRLVSLQSTFILSEHVY